MLTTLRDQRINWKIIFLGKDITSSDVSQSHGRSNLPPTWKWKGTLLYYVSQKIQPSQQIAAFDFDGTLAKTSLFKHGPDAWSLLYPSCVQKLTTLHRDGYKLVIFTNQAAIGKAKASKQKVMDEKKGRLIGFVKKVLTAPKDKFLSYKHVPTKGLNSVVS